MPPNEAIPIFFVIFVGKAYVIRTMKPIKILCTMALFTTTGCGNAPQYPHDTFTTREGKNLTLTFFHHSSLSIEVDGKYIYTDPVTGYADYARLPKADLILVSHNHYDHLDRAAIEALSDSGTLVVCDSVSAADLGDGCLVMKPGATAEPRPYLHIEAVAAYNTSEGHLQFHPRERGDCGYLLTIGGSRIYIAGDTEPTPEMTALKDLDIAFLPVNQPYTMTVDQAVEAVRTLRPRIFYPYHYGEVEERTDLDRLAREVEGFTEIRIRPME